MPATVALPPLHCRRRVLVVATLVVIVATAVIVVTTAVAAVAAASWTPWLKSTPQLAAGARMGGSEINGGGCGCGCGGDDGSDDDDKGGGSDGKSGGDGDHRRLMDAMVKVRPCWPLARGWRRVTNLGGNLQKGGISGQKC